MKMNASSLFPVKAHKGGEGGEGAFPVKAHK